MIDKIKHETQYLVKWFGGWLIWYMVPFLFSAFPPNWDRTRFDLHLYGLAFLCYIICMEITINSRQFRNVQPVLVDLQACINAKNWNGYETLAVRLIAGCGVIVGGMGIRVMFHVTALSTFLHF